MLLYPGQDKNGGKTDVWNLQTAAGKNEMETQQKVVQNTEVFKEFRYNSLR